jgi:hypothetical protein
MDGQHCVYVKETPIFYAKDLLAGEKDSIMVGTWY